MGSSDHNQLHLNMNIKSDKTKVKQGRRDFRRGDYEEIRNSLALIDGNDKTNNKTATKCWNILRGDLDSAIYSYVPMKKQGKHMSKEAFRKIRYKQNMWRVYKHTGTDKDYDAYIMLMHFNAVLLCYVILCPSTLVIRICVFLSYRITNLYLCCYFTNFIDN